MPGKRSRTMLLVAAVLAGVVVLSGCAQLEANKLAEREAQLEQYITEVDAAIAEVLAQIPADEIEDVYEPGGGVRNTSDYYVEWPKYYYRNEGVYLFAGGKRSPTEVADDLEPWLESQGWVRNEAREFPPRENRFERYYFRDTYTLTVEAYTVEPPQAQKLIITIVSPDTD